MREIVPPTAARLTASLVPDLSLSYGQVVWVLESVGFGTGAPDATFRHYLKSLRKIGLPFRRGEPGLDHGRVARFGFDQVMDLSLALSLRVYGTLPDAVAEGLIGSRDVLHGFYRRAYLEHASGLGAPVEIAVAGRAHFTVAGVWLDLHLRYAGGRCLGFGPPRVLSAFEALRAYALPDPVALTRPPLNLSALAIRVVEAALQCPRARRPHRPPAEAESRS
jgi:hypothetical protein